MSLTAYTLGILLSLPPAYSDQDETNHQQRMQLVAEAIAQASHRATCTERFKSSDCERVWPDTPQELAALLVTKGWWESRFAANVHRGECKPYECDPVKLRGGGILHRARSPWQLQKTSFISSAQWARMRGASLEATREAAWAAARILSAGRKACRNVTGAIAWYATGRCGWSRATKRYRTYEKLLSEAATTPQNATAAR